MIYCFVYLCEYWNYFLSLKFIGFEIFCRYFDLISGKFRLNFGEFLMFQMRFFVSKDGKLLSSYEI